MHRAIAVALAALAAGAAAAQGARPDPSSPQAEAAPLQYRSAFEGYRSFTDDKPAAWREANEAVKNPDSHAGHAEKPAAEPTPAPKPAPGHHDGGHK